MEAKLQRRIQRYGWDKAAGYYERYWQEQLEPAHDLLLEMADLQKGERVLDVACGTGLVTFRAAERVGPEGEVIGTDISREMVAAASQIAEENGIRQTSFDRMDAEELRLPENHFDAALCALGLMYVPDPVKALRDIGRALKPGGRATAAVWGERRRCGWAGIFPVVDERVETEVCPLFFQLGTQDTLKATFQAAGFKEVASRRISTTLRYASAEDACGAAFAGGPVALAYARFDERTRREAHEEYLATIEPYRNGNGYRIPGEYVVTRGVKI